MLLGNWKKLKAAGVVGMNRRNVDYIMAYNPRHLYPMVDDKLHTKWLAVKAGIAVPELYQVIEIEHQIRDIETRLAPLHDFVIKPAHGSGGDGILVITGRRKQRYVKTNGDVITLAELKHHVSNTLSGMYSLGGHADKAIIEYRVKFDPLFQAISYQGVPDVRLIIFQGYPVMAMVRLPTRQSEGKANLHQGAVGVGINLATGITGHGVLHNDVVEHHPDTTNVVAGLQIPEWDTMLTLAARCYEMTGLGYVGVDIILDHERGPLILELNARPGLNIQIANDHGLLPRLREIEDRVAEKGKPEGIDDRVAFVKEAFAN